MATSEQIRARKRAWYHANKERFREVFKLRSREWYAANREKAREKARAYRRDTRKRPGRNAYMRQWWAELKMNDPAKYETYVRRTSRRRAVRNLPEQVHEMRLVLLEFRSCVKREAKAG